MARSGNGRRASDLGAIARMFGAAAGCLALCAHVLAGAPRADLLIEAVTVIDPAARLPAEAVAGPVDVRIRDGKVHSVLPAGQIEPRADETLLRARGRYLIPGLWDAHVHLGSISAQVLESSQLLLLAHGVTSIRDMGFFERGLGGGPGAASRMRAVQAKTLDGSHDAPRLHAFGSVVHGLHPTAPPGGQEPFYYPRRVEDARRAVQSFARNRYADFIKPYDTLSAEVYLALLEESARRGVVVAGHIPDAVDPQQAFSRGQRSVEHSYTVPYACSRAAGDYRRLVRAYVTGRAAAVPDAYYLGYSADTYDEFLRRFVSTHDRRMCRRVIDALVANRVFYVPTHTTLALPAFHAEPHAASDGRFQYVSAAQHASWEGLLKVYRALDESDRETYAAFFRIGQQVTAAIAASGGAIVLGTDANDARIVPGFSAHDELAHLVRAGLSPLQALRAATVEPARMLGESHRFGRVAAGFEADLVLLDANPLESIDNTRSIAAVVLAGRLLDRAKLDELRTRAARIAEAPAVP